MSEEQGGHEASFEERLAEARARQELNDAGQQREDVADKAETGALSIGLRVGVELVSALLVGVAIGWGLDRLLGTQPILMALFVLLGGAAGVLNVWRIYAPKKGAAGGKDRGL